MTPNEKRKTGKIKQTNQTKNLSISKKEGKFEDYRPYQGTMKKDRFQHTSSPTQKHQERKIKSKTKKEGKFEEKNHTHHIKAP